MPSLSLDLFAAAADEEAARYRVLSGLQDVHRAFGRTCVYPYLADLVALRRDLAVVLDGLDRLDAAQPGTAVGIDWDSAEVEFASDRPTLLAGDLARWALPLIDEAIGEGRTLYEFANEVVALNAVGLVPSYHAEGFLLLPPEADIVRVLRYAVSALTGPDGAYHSLRTSPLDLALDPLATPQAWKDAIREACPELPSPAAFRLASEVELPVEETLLPVAKRKLLAFVHGEA
ncbi:MAG: hypothetical protein Rubg2KO_37220 [Rubricoccaceae bacterium]